MLGNSLALRDAVHAVEGEPFSVVYRGEPSGAVTEKTVEERIGAVTADLRAAFDCVIVEATSLTHPMSLELVAPYADGVVVLARYSRTHSAELAHAAARIRLAGLRPLGVLLTGVPLSRLEDVVAGWLPQDFAAPPAAPPGPSAIGSDPGPT